MPSFGNSDGALASITPQAVPSGDRYSVNIKTEIKTPNPGAFKQSERDIKQSLARAVQAGIRRAKSRPKF